MITLCRVLVAGARVLRELMEKLCRLPIFENFTRKKKFSEPVWKSKRF